MELSLILGWSSGALLLFRVCLQTFCRVQMDPPSRRKFLPASCYPTGNEAFESIHTTELHWQHATCARSYGDPRITILNAGPLGCAQHSAQPIDRSIE